MVVKSVNPFEGKTVFKLVAGPAAVTVFKPTEVDQNGVKVKTFEAERVVVLPLRFKLFCFVDGKLSLVSGRSHDKKEHALKEFKAKANVGDVLAQ